MALYGQRLLLDQTDSLEVPRWWRHRDRPFIGNSFPSPLSQHHHDNKAHYSKKLPVSTVDKTYGTFCCKARLLRSASRAAAGAECGYQYRSPNTSSNENASPCDPSTRLYSYKHFTVRQHHPIYIPVQLPTSE